MTDTELDALVERLRGSDLVAVLKSREEAADAIVGLRAELFEANEMVTLCSVDINEVCVERDALQAEVEALRRGESLPLLEDTELIHKLRAENEALHNTVEVLTLALQRANDAAMKGDKP